MAITTYSELQTAVANWLERSDLTDRIPEFIALAEADYRRRLDMQDEEARTSLSVDAETVALPSGYVSHRSFYLNTDPKRPLLYETPEYFHARYAASTTGKPLAYTIEGTNLVFGPTPDQTYTGVFLFRKNPDALSDANTSNSVLAAGPDVYLFGALKEAEPYLMNDERVALWTAKYEFAVLEQEKFERRKQYTRGALRVRHDGVTP